MANNYPKIYIANIYDRAAIQNKVSLPTEPMLLIMPLIPMYNMVMVRNLVYFIFIFQSSFSSVL